MGHIFGDSASPSSLTKEVAMWPSFPVHGGQRNTKYVTFELLSHAAFGTDENWDDMLETARTVVYHCTRTVWCITYRDG